MYELHTMVYDKDVVLYNCRTAAKHQRGIDVLYSLFTEDHFYVVVRVTKNSQSAMDMTNKLGLVLHCLLCEERVVLPNQNAPVGKETLLIGCHLYWEVTGCRLPDVNHLLQCNYKCGES